MRGREMMRPLPISILIASRTAVRLTPKLLHHSASLGKRVPGANSPLRMRAPISCATLRCRLPRGSFSEPRRPAFGGAFKGFGAGLWDAFNGAVLDAFGVGDALF